MAADIEYSIDVESGIVHLIFVADAPYEQWASTLEEVIARPDYRPGFDFLVDRRQASVVSKSDLRRMVEFIDRRVESFAGSRWAIVVSSSADFGMGRMGQVFANRHPTTIEIFRDREEGLRWLTEPHSV